jgi:tripartite-type tricarboxylate transporter receptor subunit TctC
LLNVESNLFGVAMPAQTPKAAIARFNKDLVAALNAPEVVRQLNARGIDASPGSPAEFTQHVRNEEKRWVPIIRKGNLAHVDVSMAYKGLHTDKDKPRLQ